MTRPSRSIRAQPTAVGPRLASEPRPQDTPEGHVQSLIPSNQAQVGDPNPGPNFVLVPPPQPQGVTIPTDLALQLAEHMRRAELQNQARSFRFSQIEAQLADLRGERVADQGSPGPQGTERRNSARLGQRSPPRRGNRAHNSHRHRSEWASSSPTRERSRSQATSRERSRREVSDSRSPTNPDPFRQGRSPPRGESSRRKYRNPFTRKINEYRVPRYLRKPPSKMPIYTGTGDPERHINKYDDEMEYRDVPQEMRCKLFPLSLDGTASEWFRTLKPESISSWEQMMKVFCSRFGYSKSKPKDKDCLLAVRQKEGESLRAYIERFNDEASSVRDLSDEFRMFFMKEGLLEESDFKRHVRRWVPKSLQEFLDISMNFINEEEGAKSGREFRMPGRPKADLEKDSNRTEPSRVDNERTNKGWRNDNRGSRDPRPRNRHNSYTELTVSNSQLLGECCKVEFADVRPPKPLPFRPGQRTNKYCRYHRSVGHETDHCNALKDDIEDLIKKGKLDNYVKRKEDPAKDVKRDRPERTEGCRGKEKEESDEEADRRRQRKNLEPIMMITGGLDGGESMKTLKRKWKDLPNVASVSSIETPSNRPLLAFGDEDFWDGKPNRHAPLIISAIIANREVKRLLVDQGSSSDILYMDLLDRMGIGNEELSPYRGAALTGFDGSRTQPIGNLDVMVTFGAEPLVRTIKVRFLVIPSKSIYNGIIGRATIGKLGAVCSTTHLKMKFHSLCGKVITVESDMEAASRTYLLWSKAEQEARQHEGVPPSSPAPKKKKGRSSEVNTTDLDARYDPDSAEGEEDGDLAKELKKRMRRPQPDGELEAVQLGDDPSKIVRIGAELPENIKEQLSQCLKEHSDLFAWSAEDMPGIPPEVACHQLAVRPDARWVAQRKRAQSQEKADATRKAVDDLLKADFIAEVKYTTWLANPVLVKKSNGKWRMCIDYTDLNRACPKDAFPVPSIDKLVDSASGFKLLSFMDAYSGYNQIAMFPPDQEKTAFMTDQGNFAYRVMPFGLKNAGATYQRMMNKVFRNQIGRNVEVYLDDMIAKSKEASSHVEDLREIFAEVRKNSMRLNPEKCTFGVRAGKFLGYCLTERGIEANPDKCRLVTELRAPTSKKEVQKLNGMVAALSRFISNAAFKSLPLFKLLKKEEADFQWTEEQDAALKQLQKVLTEPPILSRPNEGETLYLYLSVSEEALGAVLVRESNAEQLPVYFTSKVLHGSEIRYQMIEKIALALIVAARRLRPYFVAHQIVVRTSYPIRQILHRPDLAGRMIKWAVELSEFGIKYEARTAMKAQVLADFLAEMTQPKTSNHSWVLHVDGSSNPKGSGAGILLESPDGVIIEVSLTFGFPTTNNQAEYEACIAGLLLAIDLRVPRVDLFSDSLLVVNQINNHYKTEDPTLIRYSARVRELLNQLGGSEIKHVPRLENQRADVLSKLASTKRPGSHRTVIQETLQRPSISPETGSAPAATPVSTVFAMEESRNWISPILRYITSGDEPTDPNEARVIRRKASAFSVLDGKLYRRSLTSPLLKCVEGEETDYVLAEIHEGICGHHMGARSLARKTLRSGYYWPTIGADSMKYVKKCKKCQIHGNTHVAPPTDLTSLSSAWPFAWWGIDLLGQFSTAPGGNKYLIVAIDYMTKWVEAEPLATITANNCIKFFKKNIMSRFGIPEVVVTDNGTQFTNSGFKELMKNLGIKHKFTSVEHPQTNGQVEAANKILLNGLKKRLDESKGNWVEELPFVLWSYRTTPQSSTGETPFLLSYGTEAVIPIEVGELSWRTANPKRLEENDQTRREDLDLVAEVRSRASFREAVIKRRVAIRYNAKVIPRDFEVGDLVLRRADIGGKNSSQGKLAPNWEGPYRVLSKTGTGAFKLETLNKKAIPNSWNITKLKSYYV